MRVVPILLLALLLFLACDSSGGKSTLGLPPDTQILYVNSYHSLCSGEAKNWCLWVREKPDQVWRLLDKPIENFIYEEGFQYEIKVQTSKDSTSRNGQPNLRYTLLREMKKTVDPDMILNDPHRIDQWWANAQTPLQQVKPIEKKVMEGKKTLEVAVFSTGQVLALVRTNDPQMGILQEFFFKDGDVALFRFNR